MCGPNSQHDHSQRSAGVELNLDVMAESNLAAERNRSRLDTAGVRCLNLMGSPGAGKTTLLERTLCAIAGKVNVAVIEGDMTTELDAERLRSYGIPVVALTTGRACHLDAELVATCLDKLALKDLRLLFIENVGNLVCPAEFPLGAHQNVVVISITEGDDKPLKYPVIFYGADCVIITKADLAPYVRADLEELATNVHQIRPGIPVFALSAETGEGIEQWIEWVLAQTSLSSQRAEKVFETL